VVLNQILKPLDLGGPLIAKPVVLEREVFELQFEGQAKKIRIDGVTATLRTAMAVPDGVPTAVYAVVIGDLFSGRDIAQSDHQALAIYSFDVRIRLAAMVNITLRRLHEHNRAASQIITMTRIVAGNERVQFVNDP
jgi:hypothetical protein